MTATEARSASAAARARIDAQEAKRKQEAAEASSSAAAAARLEFTAKFEKDLRERIKRQADAGQQSYRMYLSEDRQDLGGQVRYDRVWAPAGKEIYGEEAYFKNAVSAREIKLVLRHLERDGFKVAVTGEVVRHDDSAAYLNSGGECGSDRPYNTRNTVLTVTW